MIASERAARVKEAFAEAYRRLDAVYADGDVTIELVRAYAPAMAQAIEAAETDAEKSAVQWRDHGGRGGIQARLDLWVKLWTEAIESVRAAV